MRVAFTHNLQRRPHTEEEAEFDTPETVAFIEAALAEKGHEVILVDVGEAGGRLAERLLAASPDVVFNTAEGTQGKGREAFVPALAEELGLSVTGPCAHASVVTLDKRLTKVLVEAAGVPTPGYVFVQAGDEVDASHLTFPVIVKPNFEGSSKGIHARSVVPSPAELEPVLRRVLQSYPDGVLIEEYIPGIDVTVPWVEGISPETRGALPPASYRLPAGAGPRAMYDWEAKHERAMEVEVVIPADVSDDVQQKLMAYTARAAHVLGLRDLGRADWRVTDDGKVYFLEVNALPSLEEGAALLVGWQTLGLGGPGDLFHHLAERARARQLEAQAQRAVSSPLPEKLRIGVVFNLRRGDLDASDEDAEFDSPQTVRALADAVEALGFEARLLEADRHLPARLASGEADLVLNIAEGRHGPGRESQVPSLCEMLQIAYTGSDPVVLSLALDKALAKEVVARAGVPTPGGQVMRTGKERVKKGLTYPLIVKPTGEGSSKGIHENSVVQTEAELRRVVGHCLASYAGSVLVETYLEGREFTVAVTGEGDDLEAWMPMEIAFQDKAVRFPVYGYAQKIRFTPDVKCQVPAHIPASLDEELRRVAKMAHQALGCRDVSRVDLRLDGAGRPCFIECNPLPGMSPGYSDLAVIAEAEGKTYPDLVNLLLQPALLRREKILSKGGAVRQAVAA